MAKGEKGQHTRDYEGERHESDVDPSGEGTLTKAALINLLVEQNELLRKTAASVYATL